MAHAFAVEATYLQATRMVCCFICLLSKKCRMKSCNSTLENNLTGCSNNYQSNINFDCSINKSNCQQLGIWITKCRDECFNIFLFLVHSFKESKSTKTQNFMKLLSQVDIYITCSASLKLWVRMYSIPIYRAGKWHLEQENNQPVKDNS